MKIVSRELTDIFQDLVTKLYPNVELKPVEITIATNEKFGDYQCNFAMINSKIIGDNPRNIAENIKNNFPYGAVVEKLEVAGPGFINIFLSNKFLSETINKIGEKYDFSFLNTKGDVVIDFSSPNIAKRMHIGHLRSTIIGESISRIYKYLGYNVVADNHIGDWGTQFGKLIVGYRKWLNQEAYKTNPIEELERVYVKFSDEADENPALEDEARAELKKLQDGEEENTKLWKEFIEASLQEYNKLYKRLDIHFDTYYGESFYNDMMGDVLKELVDKNIAKDDQGAKVVFFNEEDNLYPCIVQKKDGAYLYSTSDIATIKFRKNTYDVNKLVYLTDSRQQDHFKQVFKITDMLDWNIEKHHIWFGIIRFADAILSTRKGNIIKLEELLDEAHTRAYNIVNEKNSSLSEEEKQNIAEIVGTSSVKYADLSQNKQSDIMFEWDKILSFEGNTAPYLLYTYARIQSILRKVEEQGFDLKDIELNLTNNFERNLANHLLNLPISVLKSAETFKPNLIADYLYELSKKLNTFYNNCPILNQEENILKTRALLIKKTGEVLKEGLALLGISVLNKM
ncbi:arginine--tRNA ligase [Fusobacterium massiliense]|uniref:arginine--tRNA ligase n=1 Tax=Fusobacterium massiliense TaxID=1852365 RepID=UPI0028EC98F2|nr:arginine--tRNA ligase [Fusobacterium massiliense]